MARWLRRHGLGVGRPRVRRLIRPMGLTPIYQAPPAPSGAAGLSAPAAQGRDHRAEPHLVLDHLQPDAARLPVPGGDQGLGDGGRAGVAAEQHGASELLRGGANEQRFHRAAVAIVEVRVHLTAGRRERTRSKAPDRGLDGLLQPRPTALPAGL